MSALVRLLAAVILSAGLAACLTLPRTQFTAAQQAAASPYGFSGVRYASDDPVLAAMLAHLLKSNARGEVDVLALSGGGANGAYAAGLLYGWTRTGQRPEFRLVTGVSTGALAAPFAFLGSAWDERLKATYADPKVHRFLRSRGILGLFTPGLYSKSGLEELVSAHVTDDMLRAIAIEHAKGRILLVCTTNLDTEQLIVWDMGAIAARGGPQARRLFAEVLIASASVPGVFRPTMIAVRGAGRRFAEMHVDGQAETAFFAIPQALLASRPPAVEPYRPRLFIIVNGQLADLFAVTPHATVPIFRRTIDAASKASIRSSLVGTFDFCQRNGCDLRLASLPATEEDDPFDFSVAHIQSLFSAGQADMERGQAWRVAAQTPGPVAPSDAPAPHR